MRSKIVIWIIAALILINIAAALGLAPAKKTIRYEPGPQTYTYKIINNEQRDLQLSLYAIGQLADYITFKQDNISVDASEDIKEFRFTVNLPEGLSPGENIGKIVIEETIVKKKVETGIYTKLRVISKLITNVPYPEKYIKVRIDMNDAQKDQPMDIATTVTNLGRKDIQEVKAEFGIFDNQTRIEELETETKSLARGETEKLLTRLNTSDYKSGFYSAIATISYDQHELEIGRDFKVGDVYVEILDYTKYFIQGRVNKFDIDVENKWNKKIRNAFALIYIAGFDVIKSLTYDLEPWQIQTIISYWDTSDVEKGKYDSNVTLKYVNKTTVKQGNVYVVDEKEFKKSLAGPSYLPYIIAGIILLVLINIAWIVFIRKRIK